MSNDQEDRVPRIRVGIMTMPMCLSNFIDESGTNPVANSVMEFINNVLNETCEKLILAAKFTCEKQGITFEELDAEVMQQMAKQAVEKAGSSESQVFTGAMNEDGKPILDADYAKASVNNSSVNH